MENLLFLIAHIEEIFTREKLRGDRGWIFIEKKDRPEASLRLSFFNLSNSGAEDTVISFFWNFTRELKLKWIKESFFPRLIAFVCF